MRRVAVVGDVAGHPDELWAELVRLGADVRTGRLPEDLTVIQVGDLVHRGPDSPGAVALVGRYLDTQPGQWIQLVGNHEAQYLRDPAFVWPERMVGDPVAALRRWWRDGQLRVAASFRTETEDFLVTHAGLTEPYWRQALYSPREARLAEATLNGLIGTHEDVLFRPGHMLTGRNDPGAGPVWAAAATELLPGWLGTPMPFSQVHGHTTAYDWSAQRFRAPAEITSRTTLDEDAKHEAVALTGGRIIGIDPGHGRQPVRPWRSFVVEIP